MKFFIFFAIITQVVPFVIAIITGDADLFLPFVFLSDMILIVGTFIYAGILLDL